MGGRGWRFLHYLALSMPDHPSKKDVRRMRFLFTSLSRILPCNICARHWRELIRARPPRTGTRAELLGLAVQGARQGDRNVPSKRHAKPKSMQSAMPSILKGWKAGMRDFLFITALCLPRERAGLFGKWCRAARTFVGKEMPEVDARSRGGALNSLCRRYGCGKSQALARYSSWLNTKTKRGSGTRVKQLMAAIL